MRSPVRRRAETVDMYARREWLALRIAPWLGRRYEREWEEALGTLAEIAYGSRKAVWTSPRVLVKAALEETRFRSTHLRTDDFLGSRPPSSDSALSGVQGDTET